MQFHNDGGTGRGVTKRIAWCDSISTVMVSVYLLAVGSLLVLTRRIPPLGLGRIFRAFGRSPYEARLQEARPESGHCFVADLPDHLLSDREHASWLLMFEDGVELGPAHATLESISIIGRGRYSHWGSCLYFSTSDNSDPTSNSRSYTVREQRQRTLATAAK